MKKKDIINLVKESVKEMRSFYGVHDTYGASPRQTRNLSGYPGVMEEETFNAKDEYEDLDTSEREQVIAIAGGREEDEAVMDYEDLKAKYGGFDDAIKDYVMENLKEFTDYGGEGRYPKKEDPGDMFQQKEVEDLFPHGMASRSDKAFLKRVEKHAEWTEESGMNNTFVHMQYHETKGLEDEYFIYQTQHYNSNYDDFRNPKFTILSITKNKGTEKEEDLGQYIVDTNAYIRDLNKFDEQGNLGKRVMESPMFRTGVKMDMAPKVMAPRIKKVFDLVNGAKHPVRTPEWHKNRFKNKYRDESGRPIPFPETLKGITKNQALAMNKYANDMKNMIKEKNYYGKGAKDDMMKDPAFGALTGDAKASALDDLVKGNMVNLEALELTNDVGKDDYIDDEGRMAKSQLYKMGKYAVKLHRMLDDMEQLPAWLQAKITKASDYMSMVYHYLDYEFARRDGNLMEEVDKYKEEMLKELTEEPNEGNAFAVARLKAIKNLEDKKAKGEKIKPEDKEFTAPNGEKKPLTNVSDDDIKAAKEI